MQSGQCDSVHVQEVDGQDPGGLRVQELPPSRTAPSRGGVDARRAEDPPDRGTTDREALHGDELLCEVVVVQARVAPAGVGHDLGLERLRQSPRGAPTPGSVREARWTPLAERSPETAHLRWGESQRFGGLRGGDPPLSSKVSTCSR